jgi:hypothetical protein
MQTEELILQQTALLPEELKNAVLLYVSFLLFQHRNNMPILRPETEEDSRKRGLLGLYKGQIFMADDFDAPLEEFADYM